MSLLRAVVALALMLCVAACGVEPVGTSTSMPSTSSTGAPMTTLAETTTTSSSVVVTTTAGSTSTSLTLPGTPIDFGPAAGDILMVMGVAHDDVLNLRQAPGASQPILDRIEPTHMSLEAMGETRQLSGAFWIEVVYDGVTGWVHMGYIGYPGGVEDITAEVIDGLGSTPSASSMAQLGQVVAESLASVDPPSDIVQVTPVTTGDLHEVTFDVVGFADDALVGARIHVFGQPTASGVTLKSVEMMVICGRGVDDGACV